MNIPLSRMVADIAMVKKVIEMKNAKKTLEKRKTHDHEVAVYHGTKHESPLRKDSKDLRLPEMQEKAKIPGLPNDSSIS